MTNEELAAQVITAGDKLALEKLWLQVYKLLYFNVGVLMLIMVVISVHVKGVTLEDFTWKVILPFESRRSL